MSTPRFHLEERSGILAIYDTHHPAWKALREPPPGCSSDSDFVVCWWSGHSVESVAGLYWEVEQRWIDQARSTITLLNSLTSQPLDKSTPVS